MTSCQRSNACLVSCSIRSRGRTKTARLAAKKLINVSAKKACDFALLWSLALRGMPLQARDGEHFKVKTRGTPSATARLAERKKARRGGEKAFAPARPSLRDLYPPPLKQTRKRKLRPEEFFSEEVAAEVRKKRRKKHTGVSSEILASIVGPIPHSRTRTPVLTWEAGGGRKRG